MKQGFSSFIGKALLICLSIIFLTFIITYSYMDKYNLTFSSLIEENNLRVTSDGGGFQFRFKNWSFDSEHATSRFETTMVHEENSFDLVETIHIDANIEDVIFIPEDRKDIKVLYEREVPDTPNYKVQYSAEVSNSILTIKSNLRVQDLFTDRNYKGSITIYVPNDYRCDDLVINSTVSQTKSYQLPLLLNNLSISTNVGDVTLDLQSPLTSLFVEMNAGNVDITAKEAVDHVRLINNSGSLIFHGHKAIDTFEAEHNFGDIDITFEESPNSAKVESNAGDINLDFATFINELDVSLNIGDITIDLPNNDPGKVYLQSTITDMSSDLPIVKTKNDGNIHIDVDVGDIDVRTIN